jgi:diguanylate cyclase (GGDEF)-like protein/PAS domain S-box-containing protein
MLGPVSDEASRLRAVERLGILDTPPEQEFDQLVALAAALCDVPISTITLVDGTRQWFKAKVGLEVSETPREIAFCAHTVRHGGPLVVSDATSDPRFRDNPLVTGDPNLRFYAGVPLVAADGAIVGTLTVMDRVPRVLPARQLGYLQVLAHQAMVCLRLRQSLAELSEQRSQAEQLYRLLWDTSSDAIVVIGADDRIRYANASTLPVFGWPAAALVGQSISLLQPARLRHRHQAGVQRVLATGERRVDWRAAETVGLHADGREIPIEIAFSQLTLRGEALFVGFIRDVSLRHRAEQALRHQATHDALTGLVNRAEFDRRLRAALEAAHQGEHENSMLYLDLDQFKLVNDTCGHIAGDELLKQVAAILEGLLQRDDTLARLGGDEFGVLLQDCDADAAIALGEALRLAVGQHVFTWSLRSFPLTVSVGHVHFDDHSLTVSDVLSHADEACYLAKEEGRNRVRSYRPSDAALARRHGEMEWVREVHEALAEDRLVLQAQSIRSLAEPASGAEHVEILLRLRARDGTLVPPMAFIPAAERYNLMGLVDRWVLRRSFECITRRLLDPTLPHRFAINLSGASLGDPEFAGYVGAQLEASGIRPGWLCFEITETAAIANLASAVQLIEPLRAMGCTFALDDFGSGMSSFGYLKHLPVDYLKIDGSFVRGVSTDRVDRAMVVSINDIGHVMGLRTIAEFVEDQATLDELGRIGVDFAQGYAVGRPEPFG